MPPRFALRPDQAAALATDICEEVVLKVLLSWLPRPFIAVIAATAIRAAIRPYSIAVAPASSRINLVKNVMLSLLKAFWPPCQCSRLSQRCALS